MASFRALIGDLFQSKAQTLVNTVNCVGVMGKGVAQEFKKRYPDMFEDYERRCEAKLVKLGKPYLYKDVLGTRIINFPTKDHWRSSTRIKDVESGLDFFVSHLKEWGVTSIAMPPLGCGNGGLDWSEVGPLIYRKLHGLDVDVEVFAPYGTDKSQITERFLAAPSQMSLEGKGRRHEKMNPSWVALMEVIRALEAQPFASRVGRTIFQKICYVVTEMGVPTGLQFGKGDFGPYSEDVKLILHDFANRNWVQESTLGKMVALRVLPQYERERNRYAGEVEQYRKKINKAVDLFSRIKSTEQAEEVLTVLYAARQLKSERNDEISEQEISSYIVDWKKAWNTTEKHEAVTSAIRYLVVSGWMRARLEVPESEMSC